MREESHSWYLCARYYASRCFSLLTIRICKLLGDIPNTRTYVGELLRWHIAIMFVNHYAYREYPAPCTHYASNFDTKAEIIHLYSTFLEYHRSPGNEKKVHRYWRGEDLKSWKLSDKLIWKVFVSYLSQIQQFLYLWAKSNTDMTFFRTKRKLSSRSTF